MSHHVNEGIFKAIPMSLTNTILSQMLWWHGFWHEFNINRLNRIRTWPSSDHRSWHILILHLYSVHSKVGPLVSLNMSVSLWYLRMLSRLSLPQLQEPFLSTSLSMMEFESPCKHSVILQYRAGTGPMLPASAQYWPITGIWWHVYRGAIRHLVKHNYRRHT